MRPNDGSATAAAADIAGAARRDLSAMVALCRRRNEENAAAFDALRATFDAEAVAERRRHAESLASERVDRDRAVAAERDARRALAEELRQVRHELAGARAESEGLRQSLDLLTRNHRKLFLGFLSLIDTVEQACGVAVAVDRRIDAMLLASEIGGFLGEEPKFRSDRVDEFMAQAFPETTNHHQ